MADDDDDDGTKSAAELGIEAGFEGDVEKGFGEEDENESPADSDGSNEGEY